MVSPARDVYLVSKAKYGRGKLVRLPRDAWGKEERVNITHGTFLPIYSSLMGPVAGDISPSGEVLIKTYRKIYYWKVADGDYLRAMLASPVELPYIYEKQGEAVCWDAYTTGYYTLGEGWHQPLYYYLRIG